MLLLVPFLGFRVYFLLFGFKVYFFLLGFRV